MPGSVEISVVVPAHNEGKYINHLFAGLGKQTFKDFEVIVVVKSPSDNTIPVARRHGARVIVQKHRNIAGARNDGARIARGGVIFFTDADSKPSADHLMLLHKAFKDKSIIAASGPVLPLERTTATLRFSYALESVYLTKLSFALGSPTIIGSNFAVRRAAFERSGGFNDSLTTYEDLDLSKRLKKLGRIIYLDGAKVRTSVRRVVAWGLPRYVGFHALNAVRYNLARKPATEYKPVR